MDARIAFAVEIGYELGVLKSGSPIVLVTGWRSGSGHTNTVRIIKAPNRQKKIHILSVSKKVEKMDEALDEEERGSKFF